MKRLGNKGQGFISIIVILVLIMFFYSGFYVTLEYLYVNVIEGLIEEAGTQSYYDSYIRPMWLSFSFFFLLSLIIWGIVQTQSLYNTFSIAGIWIVILFSFTVMSFIFIAFDKTIMSDLLGMLPMDTNYVSLYEGMVKPLWRIIPIATYCTLIFFGLFMASTYAEKAGSTYVGQMGGMR